MCCRGALAPSGVVLLHVAALARPPSPPPTAPPPPSFQVRDLPGQCDTPPADGVYCHGLFLEGCKWSDALHELDESDPKV